MRSAILPIALLAVMLASCVPTTRAVMERMNGSVTITVESVDGLELVGLTVIGEDVITRDTRCVETASGVSCDLGDIPAGTVATVVVTGASISCTVSGYASASPFDFRIERCRAALL